MRVGLLLDVVRSDEWKYFSSGESVGPELGFEYGLRTLDCFERWSQFGPGAGAGAGAGARRALWQVTTQPELEMC